MSNVFFIADTHFGHTRIVGDDSTETHRRRFDSIEAHDEAIVAAWNRVVGKRDTVYHLGDVLFKEDRFALIGRLNGAKKLVMGNHDDWPAHRYLEAGFSGLSGAVKYKGLVLSHIPVHPDQIGRFRANVHGHLHTASVGHPAYVCVSCDQVGFAPQALDDVLARIGA